MTSGPTTRIAIGPAFVKAGTDIRTFINVILATHGVLKF